MARQAAQTGPDAWVRQAGAGDAADVATLLDALGYPCSRDEAAERIALVQADRRQVLLLAEADGRVEGLVALETLYSVAHGSERFTIPEERERRHHVRFQLALLIKGKKLALDALHLLGLAVAVIACLQSDEGNVLHQEIARFHFRYAAARKTDDHEPAAPGKRA